MSRLLILLTFVSWVAASNVATFTSTQVKHIELLTSFTLSSGGSDLASHKHHAMSTHAITAAREHTQTTYNGLSVPHGDAVHLTFSALGQHFSYPMRAYTELLGDQATVEVWGANGWESRPMTLRSYIKDDGSADWASMTIHPDGTFHAVVHRAGEIYQVDPVDVHSDAMHTTSHWESLSTAAHAAHRMTVFKHSDLQDANMLCGSVKEAPQSTHSVNAKSVSSPVVTTHKRHLLQSFAGDVFQCQFPSGANLAATGTITNGVVADYGLFVRYKTQAAVESFIQGIYASMNSVYLPQLATNLQLNQIVTYTQAGGDVFNVQPVRSGSRCDNGNGAVGGISITINQVLDGLTKWAQTTKKGQYSLWHQVTDCFPPNGVVGLAWVGTLCSPNRAGVSGISSTTWLTVAHEAGHNFGADHTFQLGQGKTGGIMDYGDGKHNGIYQFNRQYSESQMCAEIGSARADPTGKKLNYGTAISPFCWQPGTTSTTPGSGTGGGGGTSGTSQPTTPPVVTPPVTKTYVWGVSDWSTCSADCGGTQTRRVACIVDDSTSTIVADSLCVASQKPGSSQSCGSACVYSWVSSLTAPADCLSPTNTKCATSATNTAGTQANPQKCVLTQNGQKITVADTMCTANTKPAAVTPCTLPVCTGTATWSAPAFGPCSVACGGGTQTRTVSCISGTAVVAATQCAGQTQPPASQPCNTAACIPAASRYTVETSAWTSCPVTCGGGLQTRTIQCKDNQASTYVALTLCSNLPPSQQSCNTQTCPVAAVWATSQPGPCSATCGTGTATITVRCVDPNDKTFAALPESRCDARFKPATSVACSLPPCTSGGGSGGTTTPNSQYRWWIPSYSVRCSATKQCTIASVGTPVCINRMAQQVAVTSCAGQSTAAAIAAAPQVGGPCPGTTNPCLTTSTAKKLEVGTNSTDTTTTTDGPIVTQSEEPETNSTGPSWKATEWGECSAVCGGGSQSRNLTCVAPGGQTLPDSSCDGLRTVPLTQTCNNLACTAFWYTGGWSACSAPCDGGFMTRTTECRSTANPQGPAIDEQNCFAAPRPSVNQTCNASPCPKWSSGSWSECSATCGDGWQYRNISCQTITGIEVDVSLCTSDQRPVYNRTCNDSPCPTFVYGDWSSCNKQCGGGIQNRTVTCRLPAHGTFPGEILSDDTLCVANDVFAAQYGPPIRSRSCNEQSCPLYHYQVQSTSPCSATCGGGTRDVTFICVDAQNKATAMSDCDGLDNKPESTQRCNTAPCPTIFGWRTGNFSTCNVYCGKGVQKRDVFCINEATLETVDSRLCKAQRPINTQPCQQPESICWGGATGTTLKQGRCGSDGECICRPGFDGRNCSIAPATVQVNLPTNLYLAGVPQGENIVISWQSSGAASRVSVLIQRTASEWTMQYLARNIPNTGKFEWSVGTHIKDLDYASNYTIRVWFKPGVYGDSPAFSIADPCQYVACGKHGRCNKGQCVCAGGWGGPTCAISPCEAAGCNVDHAVCNVRPQADGTSKTTCRCQDGWTGAKCYTPPSCTGTCQNGGDYLPAAVTDIPTPTTTTNESVAATGSAPGTCPIDVTTTPCLCAGGYTGKDCNTCGLQCQNGSRADDTCTSCICPRGFFGASCSCRYYEIKLALSIDARSWIDLLVSRTRFITTFANDVAAATGLSSNNIQVQKLEIGAYGRLYVDFWLTETCKTTSQDAIGFTSQALIASSEGGDTIDTLYTNVQAQFQDADSTLNYAPVLSSIVIGSVVASDPLGTTLAQPAPPQDQFGGAAGDGNPPSGPVPDNGNDGASSSSSVNVMLIGIIVGCAVGAVILAGIVFMIIRNKRQASSTNTTLSKMNQVAMVPTFSGRTLSMNEGKKPQVQPGDEWTVNPACVSVQQRMQRV